MCEEEKGSLGKVRMEVRRVRLKLWENEVKERNG